MVTQEQREALLSVPCPWCHAGVRELCHVRLSRPLDTEGGRRKPRVRLLTSLDGGSHDARWQAALGLEAPVLAHVVQRVKVPAERPW